MQDTLETLQSGMTIIQCQLPVYGRKLGPFLPFFRKTADGKWGMVPLLVCGLTTVWTMIPLLLDSLLSFLILI